MTEKVVNITLPTDEDGMLPRQCPNCDQPFAIHGQTYEDEHYLNLRCPYCEWIEEFDEFLTEEQAQFAKATATNEALDMAGDIIGDALKDAFGGIKSSKNFKVKSSGGDVDFGSVDAPSPHLQVDTDLITCDECGFKYGVKQGAEGTHCPVCRD